MSTTDAVDTLRVVGGRALDVVDADAVRAASAHAGAAAEGLRAAARRANAAAGALDDTAWRVALGGLRPGAGAGPARGTGLPATALAVPDPAAAAHHRALAAEVRRLAARLDARADRCALLRQRLLCAAGLYESAESLAEKLVGAAATTGAAAAGYALTSSGTVRGVALAVSAGAAGASWLANAATGGWFGRWVAASGAGPRADLVRAAAPWSDEAMTGLGVGVAAGAPTWSGGDLSVTGGARVLSTLVDALLPRTRLTVRESAPTRRPAWAAEPSGSVEEALARIGDLAPFGTGLPGRRTAGVARGTLAVERVQHADGTRSWTVLIPGTQDLLAIGHPFDGATDLDLMAHRAAGVTAAVEQALDLAGAQPGERVVLVGHSLGGIAAMALAASPSFTRRHRLAGVVTAGSPTATFAAPPGVPVLHLENDEELVSNTDGRSGRENPRTADRVTVTRRLAESSSAADRAASGSVPRAHALATHLRTLALGRSSGNAQVSDVLARIEPALQGERATTRFYTARRTPAVSGSAWGRTSR